MRRKHILTALVAIIVVFIAVIIVKTLIHPFDRPPANVGTVQAEASERSLQRLAGGLRVPTVSRYEPNLANMQPFDAFKDYLSTVYPDLYAAMDTATVNTYGLVFHWPGRDPALKPLLLTAHYDTAPVSGHDGKLESDFGPQVFRPDDTPLPAITEYQSVWQHPPFSGAVADGRIYGRGTLDDKAQLFAILEAADALIAEGFVPQRDIWLAFGHDEEIGGQAGALQIAAYFKKLGLEFDAVHDEGGVISSLAMISPKATRPIALVGVAEKSFLVIKITVNGPSGHSSMPPRNGSIAQTAEIVQKLNDNPMPAKLTPPIAAFLDKAGGEMNFGAQMAIANRWLLEPAIIKIMSGTPPSNALLRTTTAITMIKGGDVPNVMSPTTEIVVNFRLMPEDSPQAVIEHVKTLCAGYDVVIETMGDTRTISKISPYDSHAFNIIESSVLAIHPNGIVSPYITIGATDAIKYEPLSANVYRFMPAFLNQYELALMHGVNEHISIENYAKMIRYYIELMRTY